MSLLAALLFPTMVTLTGCGDTNVFKSLGSGSTDSTRTEDALASLNKGDWSGAIAKLSDLPDSDIKRKYLASAYMGLAGWDTLELIATLDEANDKYEGQDKSFFWTAAGSIFADGNASGTITALLAADKVAKLRDALSILATGTVGNYASLDLGSMGDLSDDRLFQAGIASALNIIMTIAQANTVGDYVIVDPEAYKIYNSQSSLTLPASVPAAGLVKDITILGGAIANFGSSPDNALIEDLARFQSMMSEYAADNVITKAELENLINGL